MNEDTKFTDLSELLHDHESAVAKLFEMLTSFHEAREATYKRSFAKRGEIGVWMNLARKYDRFEALAPQVLLGEGSGVTLIDTLVDTLMYSAKWLDVISKIRPEDFKEWIRTVYCKDTGLSYEEVVELYPFLNVLDDVNFHVDGDYFQVSKRDLKELTANDLDFDDLYGVFIQDGGRVGQSNGPREAYVTKDKTLIYELIGEDVKVINPMTVSWWYM